MNNTPTATKDKSTQQRGKFERQFFAPFSLESCVARLESRTEAATFWAWNGEMRIQVDTWRVEAGTIGFQVYKAPKSVMTPSFGLPPQTRARGALFKQADGSTLVLVYSGTTLLGYAFYWIIAVIMAVMIGVLLFSTITIAEIWLLPIYGIVALVVMFAWWRVYYEGEHRRLLLIVENTLRKSLVDY